MKIADITAREKEVLHLICQGYSNREIAKRLFISTHTVKAHISSLLYKLQAKNRTQAACFFVTLCIHNDLLEILSL